MDRWGEGGGGGYGARGGALALCPQQPPAPCPAPWGCDATSQAWGALTSRASASPDRPQHGAPHAGPQRDRSLRPLTRPPALQHHYMALMSASMGGHTAVVDALLAAGADPKAKDSVSGWALVCMG